MRNEFIEAIKKYQNEFGLNISDEKIFALADYYELVQENNEFLHLVAPGSVAEFAIRHILESLTILEFLPKNASFADVGTGAGLPSIPCLIVREDLKGLLIESKLKKANFLQKALAECKLEGRAKIINRQFEEIEKPRVSYVSCRAIDKFTKKLPNILKWSEGCSLLFFGGNSLREELNNNRVKFKEILLPLSEQRFLFVSAGKWKEQKNVKNSK